METMNRELESIEKGLLHSAIRGKWRKVTEIYKEGTTAHKAMITKAGDTALHIAVSDNQEDIVEELVSILTSMDALTVQNEREMLTSMNALTARNERGNTPLHLAAEIGNVRICCLITNVNKSLVDIRNNDGESPLFLAALNGHKKAFLYLHSFCRSDVKQSYVNCRRKDGDTVLHCAIKGEYFDLAFQIIKLYEDLVNSYNEHGMSPLHYLATKPSSFRSGCHLERWRNIIYHCIFVDQFKVDPIPDHDDCLKQTSKQTNKAAFAYPNNYKTCFNFLELLVKGVKIVTTRDDKKADAENPPTQGPQVDHILPPNYATCFNFFKFVSKAMLVILGLGSTEIKKIEDKKEKHTWSRRVMNELLSEPFTYHEYESTGKNQQSTAPAKEIQADREQHTTPYNFGDGDSIKFALSGDHEQITEKSTASLQPNLQQDNKEQTNEKNMGKDDNEHVRGHTITQNQEVSKKNTPILIAAKNGVSEMVEKILQIFPMAIHETNVENKNVVLLAVENRQPHVYKLLLNLKTLRDHVFKKVDREGNSALHLAAKLGDHKPWLIPGEALQMQWEIKWYEFVKDSMPPHFFARENYKGETAKQIFSRTHEKLLETGSTWLTNTSESCSVVAALIATVAFATSTTVPGGNDDKKGTPILEHELAFNIFAISSLIALCFSVTSVVMFLAILTSRYQERDFHKDLPRKLLVGLTSLFVSIAAMLVSFCAGHFFVLRDKLKYAAFPMYAITCLPITFFAIGQFPLYFDLIWATFKKVPQRSYKTVAPI